MKIENQSAFCVFAYLFLVTFGAMSSIVTCETGLSQEIDEFGARQTISAFTPEDVAVGLEETFPYYSNINKISIVACDLGQDALDSNMALKEGSFCDRLIKALPENLRPKTHLSVRPGLVQVDELGFKYYASMDPTEMDPIRWERTSADREWNRNSHKIIIRPTEGDTWTGSLENLVRGRVLNHELDIKMSGELNSAVHGMSSQVAETSKMMIRTVTEDAVAAFFGIPDYGVIITEPSVFAILNAMRRTQQRIIVAGSSARLLEGCRNAMNILAESPTIDHGIFQLMDVDFEFYNNLRNSVSMFTKNHREKLALSNLVNRRDRKLISFVPLDITSPAAADYLASLQGPQEKIAALFFGLEPDENTLGPATQYQTRQFQKEAIANTLALCLAENADLVVPSADGESTHVYRQRDLTAFLNNAKLKATQIFTDQPQFDHVNAHRLVHELDKTVSALHAYVTEAGQDFVADLGSDDDSRHSFQTTRDFLKLKTDQLSERFRYSQGEMIERPVPESEPVHGLNAAFFIMALRHIIFKHQKPNSTNEILSKAIADQTWINLAGAAASVAQDGLTAFGLVHSVLQTSDVEAISSVTTTLAKTVSRIGMVSQAAGVIVNAINIGYDIYELTLVNTTMEQAVIGTQLALDVQALSFAGGAIVGGLMGMTALAATLGTLSVPLAGISYGIRGLADAFAQIDAKASYVGSLFHNLSKGFKDVYAVNGSVMIPNPASVVSEINFITRKIKMGSHLIAKTTGGWSGSGWGDYFGWAGHMPKNKRDRSFGNMRERLGHPEEHDILSLVSNTNNIVLPIQPAAVIGHFKWNLLPGCIWSDRPGWEVLRKLEREKDFNFDFYIFPRLNLRKARFWVAQLTSDTKHHSGDNATVPTN